VLDVLKGELDTELRVGRNAHAAKNRKVMQLPDLRVPP
jgi:hypothetical protein